MLYDANRKNKYFPLSYWSNEVKSKIKQKYIDQIEDEFWDWHYDYIERLNDLKKVPHIYTLFDNDKSDSDENSGQDSSSESEMDLDDDDDEIKKLKNMVIMKKGIIELNFDGIVRFFQFLGMHEEYFDDLSEYNFVLRYAQDSSNCMMKAIQELFTIQHDFLHDNKVKRFGEYQ
jgi:hypothetical protein